MNHNQMFTSHSQQTLLVVDSGVEGYEQLLAWVTREVELLILSVDSDGVEQLDRAIAQRLAQPGIPPISSIHIVAHGAPGSLRLGNSDLSLSTLNRYTRSLQAWFTNVPEVVTPSIVLYGCNIAAGDAGAEFLEKLHHLTGATIRASHSPVGHASQGGNWDLDICQGGIAPPLVFDAHVADAYAGILPSYTDGDSYYRVIDSADGTANAFVDISGTGTRIAKMTDQNSNEPKFDADDDGEQGLDLPFTFNYYGTDYNVLTVGVNGGLILGTKEGVVSPTHAELSIQDSQTNNPIPAIFPFWTDLKLTMGGAGDVYFKTDGTAGSQTFTIQWNNIVHKEVSDGVTFQVVLHEGSNEVTFAYQDTSFGNAAYDDGKVATVGLSGADGIQYSKDETGLSGIQTVRFVADPRLVNNTITIDEGEELTLTENHLKATDFDAENGTTTTYTISNLQHGHFEKNEATVTSFTQDDIDNQRIKFIHDKGEVAPSFDFTLSDQHPETVASSAIAAQITFNQINDAPLLENVNPSLSLQENTINSAATLLDIDADVALSDSDSLNFNGGQLLVTYTTDKGSEDQLGIRTDGLVEFTNGTVYYDGTPIGTVSELTNGSDGKNLAVQFNSNADATKVEAVIENLTYQNVSDTPQASRSVKIEVTDGDGGTSLARSVAIAVTANNDAPVITAPDSQTVNEDSFLTFTGDTQILLDDVDSESSWIEVTLTATQGTLSFTDTVSTLIASGNISDPGNTTDVTSVTFEGSVNSLNTALDGMTFDPDENYNGAASVKVDVNDKGYSGNAGSADEKTDSKTVNIEVSAVNDAPKNSVPLSTQSTVEDTDLVFSSANTNLISIADLDLDEGNGVAKVTLSVDHGKLTLNQMDGLSFTIGNGTSNPTMAFEGNLADINAALNGLTYRGNQNHNGNDTLTILTDDLGNSGAGGNRTDEDTVAITVSAVNDAPENTVPGAQSVGEDTDLVFSVDTGNAIAITDLDVSNPSAHSATVDISVDHGTLTLSGDPDGLGLTFAKGDGTADKQIIMTGTMANLNTALDGLVYRGSLNYNGSDILSITTDDLKNIGTGTKLTDADTVSITVLEGNDAPINQVPGAQEVDEDTVLAFKTDNNNAIVITDLDNPTGSETVRVSLSVSQGTLTLGDATDVSTPNGMSGDTLVIEGSIAATNAALQSLTYKGDKDYNGNDTLTISTDDLGNIGSGSNLVDEDTVAITVKPVNDEPENVVPNVTQTVAEDIDLVFSTATGNAIAITDLDVSDSSAYSAKVDISVTHGTLTLNGDLTDLGLSFDQGDGTADKQIIMTGTIDNLNTALDGLVYHGDANYNGDDILRITTNDLRNIGSGLAKSDIDEVNINVLAVNDAPINHLPTDQTVNEDTDLFFSSTNGNSITISDLDAAEVNGNLQVNLSVSHGVLTLSDTTGVTTPQGTSGRTVVIEGELASINTVLGSLKYKGDANYNGSDILDISTSDLGNNGSGGALVDDDSFGITVTAINDAPVNGVPATAQSVNEDTNLIFSGDSGNLISISDLDAGSADILRVTLTAGKGVLTLGSVSGLTFVQNDGANDKTMTFEGAIDNINTALNGLIYRGNQDFNGTDTVTITTNDKGNTGNGLAGNDTDYITINVSEMNDAPHLTGVLDNYTFNEQALNETPAIIQSNVTLTDVDSSDFENGWLAVTYPNGSLAEDFLGVQNQGTAPGQIGVDGTDITYGGTSIGTLGTNGALGSELTITFNSSATVEAVEALIESLTYQNQSDTPSLARTIDITLNDGDGGTSIAESTVIYVNSENDLPTIGNNTLAIRENEKVDITSTQLSASDVDNDASALVFKVSTNGAGYFLVDNVQATEFTQQQIADGLVEFQHNGGEVAPSYEVRIFDGEGTRSVGNAAIHYTEVNDAPTLAGLTELVSFSSTEANDGAAVIDSSVSFSDVDSTDMNGGHLLVTYTGGASGDDQLSVLETSTIEVSTDSIFFNDGGTSVKFGEIDTNDNGANGASFRINFTSTAATVPAVKALIESLAYRNTSDTPVGDRTIAITVNDGDSAAGTSQASSTVISITPENDAPTVTAPATGTIDEDGSFTFASTNLITIADPDAGNSPVKLTLVATGGTMTLSGTTALTFEENDGTDDVRSVFTGSLVNINQALNGMVFEPNENFNGNASVQITIDDQGNTGDGGAKQDTQSVAITVNAINDEPTITASNSLTIDEDTDLVFAGNKSIRVTDVDSSGQQVQATLSVNQGTLTLNGDVTGLDFVSGSGVDSKTMTFKATVADINAALDGMVYRGDANFNSSDTLTLEINDLGNTGEGGELTATKEIDLTVTAVNDAPVNTMPVAQTVDEETTLILNQGMGNAIQVADIDADESTGTAQVTVTAGNGVLTLAQTVGLSFLNGDGTTDSTMTFSGSLEALNAALNGMAYRGNKDFFGQDAITVTTSDLGHTGKPGTLIDSDTLAVTVRNLNDAPTISGTPPVSVVEGNAYSFTPTAQDVDGDRLTFSVLNKPSWAAFDPNTGTLSGNPVEANIGVTSGVVIQVSDGIETINLSPFSLEVLDSKIRGGGTNDSLVGSLANDIILGLAGDDTLQGGDGNDTMYGDSGNDLIFGENGNDTLYGSTGNDRIDGGNGADVIYGEAGKDKLFGQKGRDTLYGGSDKDTLKGGKDNDRLYGDADKDKLFGDDGNDLLIGGKGNDRLKGGRGNDNLVGFKGNDKLIGGSDNDILDGGKGKDKHKGGSGKDVFVMNTKGYAVIKDYKDGLDKLAIAGKNGKKFFRKLGIVDQGRHTLIELGDDQIGKLRGVDADLITRSDFTRV